MVQHREDCLVKMPFPIRWFLPQEAKVVMHPAHVPFERKPQPTVGCRPGNFGPIGRFLGDRHDPGMPGQYVMVDVLQEGNRLKVFPAAVLVRQPFAFLARVIKVKHRRDGIDPQAIHMKTIAPVQRIGCQEVADFRSAVVENIRPPVWMLTAPGIGVLVQRRAVELRQRKIVPREMRRHPVEDHADAGRVQRIDQRGKLIRCAVPARRRVKPGHLIPPRRVVCVLGHRHQLNVRETHLPHIVDQLAGQLAVRV